MPYYAVYHSHPLNDAQRDELASQITRLHSTIFTTPSTFVNVAFHDYAQVPHYVGGRRQSTGSTNLIMAQTRPGPSRGREDYQSLCQQLESTWKTVTHVSTSGARPELTAIWILGSIAASYEHGFLRPQAGGDKEWFRENLPAFREKAREGNPTIQMMLQEAKGRPEFAEILAEDAPGGLSC